MRTSRLKATLVVFIINFSLPFVSTILSHLAFPEMFTGKTKPAQMSSIFLCPDPAVTDSLKSSGQAGADRV